MIKILTNEELNEIIKNIFSFQKEMIAVDDGKSTIEILSMSERVSMDIMRLLIAKGIDLDNNSDL